MSRHGHRSHEPEDSLPVEQDLEGKEKASDDPIEKVKKDEIEYLGRKRERWWQIWRPRHAPPPPKATLADADVIPLAHASILSKLTFNWVTPIMIRGYQRPLQATDLWKMDPSREADYLSERFLKRLAARRSRAEEWNATIKNRKAPWLQRSMWRMKALRPLSSDYAHFGPQKTISERRMALESEWRQHSGKRKASVTLALNDVMVGFWAGGLFKVLGDTAQIMGPLVVKALINFSKQAYAADVSNTAPPNIGRGIGMALGLWGLTIMASICQHQFFFRSMACGVLARATLITAVYKHTLAMSVVSKSRHTNGKILNHISSDISRIDYCAQWFHAIWTAPIQLILTLVLLLVQIGPSALVGFSLFILLAPLQTWFMKLSYRIRSKSMKWTDARSKLLRELLASMQIIKVFTYEIPFLRRLHYIRTKELRGIRKILTIRAANQAMAFSIPTLASVLAFVTYSSTHSNFDPALIFTSLAFFNLLRQPLMFLPRALSSLTDAQNAMERLTEVFEAETTDHSATIDENLDMAICAVGATFRWEGGFAIENFDFSVPRGQLVAICGSVGAGKSSLLQGLIGEMPLLSGTVKFGGQLAYCQQNAWIQNTTLRENILFGQPWNEKRYWQAVSDASLMTDLEILPDGDLTEIGEKGVNLSGGQKQRVNIARALYFQGDIVLLDDPLSAVDAHVGKSLFDQAIMGLRSQGKTVILVTHAVHVLPLVDHIYMLRNGRVVEHGSFQQLTDQKGELNSLILEFSGSKDSKPDDEDVIEVSKPLVATPTTRAIGTGKLEGRLMVSETRKTGSVGLKVYKRYLSAGRARYTSPLTLVFAIIMQGAQVMSTVWLTYWQENKFGHASSFYEGIYSVLGITQAIFTFLMGATLGMLSFLASKNLHRQALQNVFYGPMSVFETQPLGRILGVFGKDVDTVDNQLADSLRMMAMTLVSLIGSVIIVTVYLHYFIVVIFVVGIGYWYFSVFYRTSARELKRLDAILRGLLYSHFSESLTGLATIRAYNEVDRFIKDNAYYMDLENRAYLLTATNQRWLSIRLDFLGGCLVFAVAVMAAKAGSGLSPSEIALCLTYMTSIVQIFGMVTRQSAEVENNMNAVERIVHYADKESMPQEAPHFIVAHEPPSDWPSRGEIAFRDVSMSYRKGLPTVLKSISLDIHAGERIGIVGRTGAGKTSITVALYRLAELTSGSITIDGIDIASIGLNALRSRIAIIPQDPILFNGTMRSNLDPFSEHPDIVLFEAMKRASLNDPNSSRQFTLETEIEDEGLNLSVGERSLVSLARALVKDAQVVVLDEATAAVDLATDAKIQTTIREEFVGKTLICIAHRLRTIISWDRILVMDSGRIQDFDTPLHLFDKGGLFTGLCEGSQISRDDIIRAS